MSDLYPPKKSLLIGRWQPLHAGHIELIRSVLAQGRQVVIGIMKTPPSVRNPFTVEHRRQMFETVFADQIDEGALEILEMPWIDECVYGRDCGWTARRQHIDPAIEEAYSGTRIRQERDLTS